MIERLQRILARPERRIVGLMSGTSMDGVDAALVRVAGAGLATRVRLERFVCVPYPAELEARLRHVAAGEAVPSAEHARLHFAVAERFAAAALAVIESAAARPDDIDLLGVHGQTLFHHATAGPAWRPESATWQAGSLPAIAAQSGIVTVGDFRSADVALGGTGAPLVPYVDFLLRRSPVENRILLNVGGIANLTYLRAGAAPEEVLAWDTGPGNMVMDGVARALLGIDHDPDGTHAARGRADESWVGELLDADYFRRPPPKSAGREQFGRAYVDRFVTDGRSRGLGPEDLLACAVSLTARAVAGARHQPPLGREPVDAVYVTGGGRHNTTLVRRLQDLLAPATVHGFEALGLDPDAKEAVDFAVLANETLHGHAGNIPSVTGARRPCVLGALAAAGLEPRSLGFPGGAA